MEIPAGILLSSNLNTMTEQFAIAVRFSYGAAQRLPRIFDSAIEYDSYIIPPGVPVSLSIYIQHHDERIFPSSYTFNPDRWLNKPQAPSIDKPLSNYLVSFSTRHPQLSRHESCLCRAVHWAGDSFSTREHGALRDAYVPVPKAGTKGVRVLIK